MPRTPHPPAPWVQTGEPLFWLTGAGHEFITPERRYFFDARTRTDKPHVVLQLTLAGAGFFDKSRRRHLLTAGAAFLHVIPGDFSYGYPPERTDTYEQVFVSTNGPLAFRWYDRIVAAHGPVLRFDAAAAATLAAGMLALARQRGEGAPRDRYLISAQLNTLVMTIVSAQSQSRLAVRPLAARAMDLLHRHAADRSFDVASLAALLGVSREHLARAFRGATGVAPSDYLIQHRLRLAARLLRGSSDKLDAIAHRAGFAGANYLCRAFRGRFGVTPGQFRARPWLTSP